MNNKLIRSLLFLVTLSVGLIAFPSGDVYAGSCSASYSISPPSPPPNTLVNVTFNAGTTNNLCIIMYRDGSALQDLNQAGEGSSDGGFNWTVYSGAPGQHTLQAKYGQGSYYPNVDDCWESVTCNSFSFTTVGPPTPTPTPTPTPRMEVSGDCNAWNVTVPGNTGNLALDFFLDRSQNPNLGIRDSVGGENGGNATYYLGGTTISGTSKSINLRQDLLNHNSLNPQSDGRNPKEVLYQGRQFKVTAYAHTPGGWAATDMVGSGVFSFPACNLDTAAPASSYTTAPQSGCQAASGTYNDPDFPNGIDGGTKQVDFYIMNADNQDALRTAGARYEDGTPVAPRPAGMDGNIYLGFARPDRNGNWTFDPNQSVLRATDFYRTPKQYNPYNILFTDPGSPALYKITAFAIGTNALGDRADGLNRGNTNFSANSAIPGYFLLSCQRPVPSCGEGNFDRNGEVNDADYTFWKGAFLAQLTSASTGNWSTNCSSMTPDLVAFNKWRIKKFGQ